MLRTDIRILYIFGANTNRKCNSSIEKNTEIVTDKKLKETMESLWQSLDQDVRESSSLSIVEYI